MKKIIHVLSLAFLVVFAAAKPISCSAGDFLEKKAFQSPDFKSGKAVWIGRIGLSFNGATGEYFDKLSDNWDKAHKKGNSSMSHGFVTGYDFSFGFNKSFGHHPMYWGMELGLSNRGYNLKYDWAYSSSSSFGGTDSHSKSNDERLLTYNVRFSPFTLGYKYTFLERMAADIHIGGYASYDFAGNYKTSSNDIINSTVGSGHHSDKTKDGKIKISDLDGMRKYDAGIMLGFGYWFGRINLDFTWQRGFISIWDNDDAFTNSFQLRLGYAF